MKASKKIRQFLNKKFNRESFKLSENPWEKRYTEFLSNVSYYS